MQKIIKSNKNNLVTHKNWQILAYMQKVAKKNSKTEFVSRNWININFTILYNVPEEG